MTALTVRPLLLWFETHLRRSGVMKDVFARAHAAPGLTEACLGHLDLVLMCLDGELKRATPHPDLVVEMCADVTVLVAMAVQHVPPPGWRWFTETMEDCLRGNDHKGGWHDCSPRGLVGRIYDEDSELRASLDQSHRNSELEAADVANFALMIADHYRVGGPSKDQGRTL